MTSSTETFPPPRLADLSVSSAGNFISLAKKLNHSVTLVLGAGVSSSAGIPFWGQLLERMCAAFFEHWMFDNDYAMNFSTQKPPSKMSIAFADHNFYSIKAKELGKTLASGDLLLAAQQIKNCIRDDDWRYLLRKILYGPIKEAPRSSFLIESLGRLCACNTRSVRSVISYNYDDLLAHVFSANGTKYQRLYDGKKPSRNEVSLPIYFVHGLLPIKGGVFSRIVLAETDYQQEAASPFAWGNQVQLQHFTQSTCVFVGNSMTDPNARRLLRLARTTSESPHFCFLPQSNSDKDKPFELLFDHDLRKMGVLPIRFPKREADDPYSRLPELIDLLARAASNADAVWE